MSKRALIALSLLGALFPTFTYAGSVTGKIKLANVAGSAHASVPGEKENVVIWLEGQEESQVPDTPVKISQKNLQFAPDFVVVMKGQKVDMPNDDDVAHNVYSFNGANQFNLGIYPKGENRSVSFEKTGIVDVFCSIHRQMHARVFVVPTRYFVTSLPGQAFSIQDVPPGRYVLKAWHERSRMVERSIVVPKAGAVTENLVLDRALSTTTAQR